MGKSIQTESLPVKLTVAEKLDFGTRVSRSLITMATLQVEAKNVASDYKERVKFEAEESARLARCIHSGIEHREIEIREIVERQHSHAAVYRADTGELVRTRPLTPAEMQKSLDEIWDEEFVPDGRDVVEKLAADGVTFGIRPAVVSHEPILPDEADYQAAVDDYANADESE